MGRVGWMRVIAGELKGRRLAAPAGTTTRPVTDRVREAIFGALESMGVVEGASVLDLFAGSGALGIEALSRGASMVTFVERDPRSRSALTGNVSTLGLEDRAHVVSGDALRWLRQSSLGEESGGYDLAFADPPYTFDDWSDLLSNLPAAVVVARSNRQIEVPPDWRLLRSKWYGTTLVVIAERVAGT